MLGLNPTAILYVLILIFCGLSFSLWWSQKKFKDKMLCYFIRPNKQKIEKWVPAYAKYIKFDRGKWREKYRIDPTCITMQWYDRGFNKMFPTFVQTLEFRWDSVDPIDPETFEPVNRGPEEEATMESAEDWQAFNKATREGTATESKISRMLPLILIGLVAIMVIFVYWKLSGQIAAIPK